VYPRKLSAKSSNTVTFYWEGNALSQSTRRTFLKVSAGISASTLTARQYARAWEANRRLVIGIIGCGGRGGGLAQAFAEISDIAYVCDPDRSRCERLQGAVKAKKAVTDPRQVLDDRSVDAVVIATPDHWHAPLAILVCEVGKHVYVEKPLSHNFRESQLLVEAARRARVVVQHGTQARSSPLINKAIQLLHTGVIGDVLVAKAWNVQRRVNIGHEQPSEPPPGVDYDMWVGPAEFVPFQKNRFHYTWHWWYNFGTGDIGNDGVHELDYGRWGLGVSGLPNHVMAEGGKYFFDDDQEFPDTVTCAFEWTGDGKIGNKRQLILEMRIWSTNWPYGEENGVEFYGTEGRMVLAKDRKIEIYGERDRFRDDIKLDDLPQMPPSHQADFVEAIRTGKKPTADVIEGHHSVALTHLANIAVRVGRALRVDPQRETIIGDEEASRLLRRNYREGGHWAIPKGL